MAEPYAVATYGDGTASIDPAFMEAMLQLVGDWYFMDTVIATLLVLILGLLCFIAFRLR